MSSYEYLGSILNKDSKKKITESIYFSIHANNSLAIIGQSGSGKTLTALSIMSLLPNNLVFEGTIIKDGVILSNKELKSCLGKDIVYIPQNGHEFLNPSLKVKNQLKDTIRIANSNRTIEDALSLVGFNNPKEIMNMYPFELSGGMAQRVTIANALLSNPNLVIADEATNGLDYKDANNFINDLNRYFPLASKIVITHDLRVAGMCDYILVMHNGKEVLLDTKDNIFNSTHPYITSLKQSLVSSGMNIDKLYEEDNYD